MKKSKILKGSLAIMLALGCVSGCNLFKKDDEVIDQKYEVYKLAKESGATYLTYEEWLDTIKGAKGDKGDTGDAGSTWLTGTANPRVQQGKNGDFYFNSVAQTIFFKENNVWLLKSDLSKKDIKTFEKIDSTLEYDTYKVTYVDNTTDTFNVKKGDIVTELDEEIVKELFDEAMYNSIQEDEVYVRMSTFLNNSFIMQITFDESGLYSKTNNGTINSSSYQYIVFNEDKTKMIQYTINENNKKTSVYYKGTGNSPKEILWDEMGYSSGMFDINVMSINLKKALLENVNDDYEIDSTKIITEMTYDYKNGKYVITVTASYSDDVVEGNCSITYKFSDRIETMDIECVYYDKEGEEKIENEELSIYVGRSFKYNVEETLIKTDFSEFPLPE